MLGRWLMASLVVLAGCDDGHVSAGPQRAGGDAPVAGDGAAASDGPGGYVPVAAAPDGGTVPGDCSSLARIVSSPRRNGAFAAGADSLSWVAPSLHAPDNGVFRAPKSGGDVVRAGGFGWGFTGAGAVADGTLLYYSISGNLDGEAGLLYRMTSDGQSTLLSHGGGSCTLGVSSQLAADEHELFWVEFDDPHCPEPHQTHLVAMAKAGGTPRLVATAPRMMQLHVDGGYAWFIDDVGKTVSRVPTAGGAIEPFVTSGLTNPTLLAVAGGALFVGDDGRVLRVAAAGSAYTVVWTHPPEDAGQLTALLTDGAQLWVGWDDHLGRLAADGSGFWELGTLSVAALALDERYLYVDAGDVYRLCR